MNYLLDIKISFNLLKLVNREKHRLSIFDSKLKIFTFSVSILIKIMVF